MCASCLSPWPVFPFSREIASLLWLGPLRLKETAPCFRKTRVCVVKTELRRVQIHLSGASVSSPGNGHDKGRVGLAVPPPRHLGWRWFPLPARGGARAAVGDPGVERCPQPPKAGGEGGNGAVALGCFLGAGAGRVVLGPLLTPQGWVGEGMGASKGQGWRSVFRRVPVMAMGKAWLWGRRPAGEPGLVSETLGTHGRV